MAGKTLRGRSVRKTVWPLNCTIFCSLAYCVTVGHKIKKVQGKKTHEIKWINFMKFYFFQIPFFAISKMANYQWTGKKFKTAKSAISRKKSFDLFDFISFLPGLFKICWPAVSRLGFASGFLVLEKQIYGHPTQH